MMLLSYFISLSNFYFAELFMHLDEILLISNLLSVPGQMGFQICSFVPFAFS